VATSSAPNLFVALELNPDEPWTLEAIRSLLEKKKLDWSKDSTKQGPKAQKARLYLDRYGKKWKTITDEGVKIEAEEARLAIKADRDAKLEEMDGEISSLAARGFLYQEELDKLALKYKEIISEEVLKSRIRVPIKVSVTTHQKTSAVTPTDQATVNQMKPHLEFLGFTDLYAFLGIDHLGSRIGLAQLRDLADKKYSTAVNGLATDLKNQHTKDLAGICQKIFKTDDSRSGYEEYLRQLGYQDIRDEVMNMCKNSVMKEIAVGQVEHFLSIAAERSLDRSETFEIVKSIAKSSGFSIILPEGFLEQQGEQQICGSCGKVNSPDKNNCTECGDPLKIKCPRCGEIAQSMESACGSCGFPIGNSSLINLWLEEAQCAVRETKWKQARSCIDLARKAWPSHVEDLHVIEINKIHRVIEAGLRGLQEQVELIQKAIDDKCFYRARIIINDLKKSYSEPIDGAEKFENQINEVIFRVETLCAEGSKIAKQDIETSISKYASVLMICADCKEAVEFLRLHPPEPPSKLQAKVIGKLVRLTWEASHSDDIQYRIIRNEKSSPNDSIDGFVLGTVNSTTFDDGDCPGGIPVFYAVYASRAGIVSKTAAMLADPIQLFPEVENLTSQVTSDSVRLCWKPQTHAFEVVVIRNPDRMPTSVSDGLVVPLIDSTQVLDRGLKSDTVYHYAVYCCYRNIRGEVITSQGICVRVVPQLPPEPITDMTIRVETSGDKPQILLAWSPPLKGQVVILKTTKLLPFAIGEFLFKSQLRNEGEVLTPTSNNIVDTIDCETFVYYIPLVLYADQAIVGQLQKFINVPDIKELEVQNIGFALRIKWRWPAACEEVRILVAKKMRPEPGKADREIVLMKSEYELKGYYDLTGISQDQDVHINIHAVHKTPSGTTLSAGEYKKVVLASQVTVMYEINHSWLTGANLKIRVIGKGVLPRLLLIRKRNLLPMNSTDGDIVLRTEAIELNGGEINFTYPINRKELSNDSYGRLFLEDNGYSEIIMIRHPESKLLKL
jgi:hypothetical protein